MTNKTLGKEETKNEMIVVVKAKCGGCHKWLYAKNRDEMKSVHQAHLKVCPTILVLEKISAMGETGEKLWALIGAEVRENNLRKFLKKNHLTTDEARDLLDAIDINKRWENARPSKKSKASAVEASEPALEEIQP